MALITHDQWIARTKSLTSPRSDLLKKVDAAIKAHDGSPSAANKGAIKTALDRWRFEQSRQGKDWTRSVRNRDGAVTELHRALSTVDKRQLTPEERAAMDYIAQEQARALQKQFIGKKLQFKRDTVLGMANAASTAWDRFKTGSAATLQAGVTGGLAARNGMQLADTPARVATFQRGGVSASHAAQRTDVAGLRPKIIAFIESLCPQMQPQTVFDALRLGNVEQFVVNLAPFIGTISSGGKALVGWIGVANNVWDRDKLKDRRIAFRPGDPEAAFDALIVLLDRDIAAGKTKAGVHSAAFTGKLLGSFADGGAVSGPVLGTLETLAQIFQLIVDYVRDYKEVQRANKLIQQNAFNLSLFNTCPVLGCYFLVIQDHSTIINFAVADYGTPNWMMDVERLVKKIQIVLERAQRYIRASRFEIPGMENAKGIQGAAWSHKTGLAYVAGAPGAALGHVGDAISNQIDAWRGKGAPKVDRSRIIGFGPEGPRV